MKKIYFSIPKIALLCTFVALIGSSCVSLKEVKLMQKISITDYSNEIENKGQTEYQINNGDQLYIKIFSLDPKTSKLFQSDFPELINSSYIYLNSYVVDENGYVSFSFTDKIMVKGLTLLQAQETIKNALGEFFNDINVYVKLVGFNVTFLGEVRSPGNYVIDKEQVNILQGVGKAGGFTDYAFVKNVTLIRKSVNGSIVREIDLTDNGILTSEYMYLMPDDVIYVAPRNTKPFVFEKFPYGAILGGISFVLSMYAIFK
jgi:polysaccharide biosynthesis/export protein